MQSHHVTIIGLVLDIVGAFLVSVEAIKLENFRALRDRFLRVAHEHTLSPRVRFVGEDDDEEESQQEWVPSNFYPGLFMGLHYVAGFILIVAIDRLTAGWILEIFLASTSWVLDQAWYFMILLVLAFVVFGVLMGLWMLGELVHVSLTFLLKSSIRFVDLHEEKTEAGMIGLIGFLLLVFGFLLQIVGVSLGA